MGTLLDFFLGIETKTVVAPGETPVVTPLASDTEVRNDLLASIGESDETVNRKTALQISAVVACGRVLAEGLAQVPCKLYKEDARGSLIEARDHPLFKILHRKPNPWQTSFEFREQIGWHLALEKNAYIAVTKVLGEVREVYAFEPENVSVVQNDDRSLTYKVSVAGKTLDIPGKDMWHLRGAGWNGYQGDSLVQHGKRTFGLALSTEKFGSALFQNMARPGGILTTRSGATNLTPDQRKNIMDLWQRQYRGASNAHKTALLPYDLEFTAVAGTADEAQWIESRKFIIEEVCRFFGVMPIMAMQSGATSYASVEQLFLAHLTYTLMPMYQRFEQSAENALLTDEELDAGYRIKLNANALLRGSTAERTAYYNTMVTIGAMTVNEVRAKEDLPLSTDPEANKLRGAANLFGSQPAAPTAPSKETPSNDEPTDEVIK